MVRIMRYCYSCNRNVDSTVKMIRESYRDVNGNHINTSKVIRICDRCGKEIPDNKINDCGVQKSFRLLDLLSQLASALKMRFLIFSIPLKKVTGL